MGRSYLCPNPWSRITSRRSGRARCSSIPTRSEVTRLVGGELLCDGLTRFRLEVDVVTMQMDLAVGVAGDVERHAVVLVRLQITRSHNAAFGHRDADRHILATPSAVGVNENSARNDENNKNNSTDKSARSAHSFVIGCPDPVSLRLVGANGP